MGIRKILPLLESAVLKVLDQNGMPREYNGTYTLGSNFWDAVCNKIMTDIEHATAESSTISKLSLDRAAPRQRKV